MRFAKDTAPDNADFDAVVAAAIATLPDAYRENAKDVVVRIEDIAPSGMLDEMEIDDPFTLTGLYEGTPLTDKSVMDQPMGPDTIWLFRRPILDEWAARGDVTLGDLVTHVYIHELAHHFGWSDADIARIDAWWD